jgi:hypothetical protein
MLHASRDDGSRERDHRASKGRETIAAGEEIERAEAQGRQGHAVLLLAPTSSLPCSILFPHAQAKAPSDSPRQELPGHLPPDLAARLCGSR